MQICLARACGGAYVTALCLLTALGAAFFSILRTKADPGSGILSVLGYTISILTGEFTWPARVMWRQVLSMFLRMLLAIALECGAKLGAQNCMMCWMIMVSQDVMYIDTGQQHNAVVSKAGSNMQVYKIKCHLTDHDLACMTRIACAKLRHLRQVMHLHCTVCR